MTTRTPNKDIHQIVTDQIIAAIEEGAGDWEMPWHCDKFNGMPNNIGSGKNYNGINVVSLWGAALVGEYEQPVWGTYRQWKEKGAQVRKDENGTKIIYYNTREITDKVTGEVEKMPFLRSSSVFNIAQVDGFELPVDETPLPNAAELIERAELFVANTGAKITYKGQNAVYRPATDEILIPERERFFSTGAMYSTICHELIHYCDHPKRTDRSIIKEDAKNKREAYAAEELVAELGGAMLCGSLGIKTELREDHAAYIQYWLETMKADKKAIFKAAAMAQKSVDYLYSLQPATEVAPEEKAA